MQAMKQLYMLGNSKPHNSTSAGSELGGNVMGGVMAAAKPKPKPDPRQKLMADAIDYQTKQKTMQDAISSATMAQSIDQARKAQGQQRLNDQAVKSPIGGLFTDSGFQQHANQTGQKASDIQTSNRLMGAGQGMQGSFDPFREEF